MAAWSHLPNAIHIDRVLASVKSNPDAWEHLYTEAREEAINQAWEAMNQAVGPPSWQAPWMAQACFNACTTRNYSVGPVDHARGVLLALIAYDDCAKYLDLPLDQLKMLYLLNEHPACLLLQPAVLVFAKEKELA
jgi:hypothetical protein